MIDCNFDGGDCCGPNVKTDYCKHCVCLGGNGTKTTTKGNYNQLHFYEKRTLVNISWNSKVTVLHKLNLCTNLNTSKNL